MKNLKGEIWSLAKALYAADCVSRGTPPSKKYFDKNKQTFINAATRYLTGSEPEAQGDDNIIKPGSEEFLKWATIKGYLPYWDGEHFYFRHDLHSNETYEGLFKLFKGGTWPGY